jgi:hypothetical protein
MNTEQIKAIQRRIGAEPDGFWGPKSIRAVQAHLRGMMPQSNPWPDTSQEALTKFYGKAGDETRLVKMSVPAGVTVQYEGRNVSTILCHERVADSLSRILVAVFEVAPLILREYAGVYNNRPMRGGSLPSLHARGAAIDFAPETNANHAAWPVASDMPLCVMECFAREGWISAGAFWGRDAMHAQATR